MRNMTKAEATLKSGKSGMQGARAMRRMPVSRLESRRRHAKKSRECDSGSHWAGK
jgi:hypothetical protein